MKKNNKLIIGIIIAVIVLVLVIAAFVFAYFTTDMFKSNKSLFIKYISQNGEIVNIFKQDENLKAYIEKQKNTPYELQGTLKFSDSFNTNNLDANIANILKNSSITISGNTDKTNNYTYRNAKLNYSETESMNAEYINIQDYYGLRIQDVNINGAENKYIAINNNNLKEWFGKLGLNGNLPINFPDKIDLSRYDYSHLFTDEELKTISKKYQTILLDNLTDDMFSKSKSVGDSVYTLTINKAQIQRILNQILAELKEDTIILNKIKGIMINDFQLSDADATNYISQLQDGINNYITEKQSNTSSETLTINVLVNNKKLVKTEIIENNNKISLTKLENGIIINFIDSNNNEFIINFEKSSAADIVKYLITMSQNDNKLFNLEINYSGLSTLTSIQETFDYSMNFLEQNVGYYYTGVKQFNPEIVKENITENDMLFLNGAPNGDVLQALLNQVLQRVNDVNAEKKARAGITDNNIEPATLYAPALIPFGVTKLIEQPISISNQQFNVGAYALGGISFILSDYSDNYISMDINGENEREQSIIEQEKQEIANAEMQLFNSEIEQFQGEGIDATRARALLNTIISSNHAQEQTNHHIITVTYMTLSGTTQTCTDNTAIQQINIQSGYKYDIVANKDINGYINSVNITEKENTESTNQTTGPIESVIN